MFGKVDYLRERLIPPMGKMLDAKKGYRQWPIALDRKESREQCVEITTLGIAGMNYYHREDNPPYNHRLPYSIPELYLRESVAKRLLQVNTRLAPHLEVFVHDAWRPATLQYYLREWFRLKLHAEHPEWSLEQLEEELDKYIAAGVETEGEINPESPAPHSTGAAFDVTLRWCTSKEFLDMGTGVDEATERAQTDALEVRGNRNDTFSSKEEEETCKNRRLLYWVMREAGFQNNPTEWWHYSFGDQMAAKLASSRNGIKLLASYSNTDPR